MMRDTFEISEQTWTELTLDHFRNALPELPLSSYRNSVPRALKMMSELQSMMDTLDHIMSLK